MKTFVSIAIAVLALVIGFASGVQFEKLRHARADVQQLLRSHWSEVRGTAVVSLGALDALEAGDTAKAKSELARFIGIYYRAYEDQEASLQKEQRLIPSIEDESTRSPALKSELQKPSK